MYFGFGLRLSAQAMKIFQRKDPVNDQVTDYPFVVCFQECLGILWVVKTRISTFSCCFWRYHRRPLPGEYRACAISSGQALHPFCKGRKSGFPLCAIAVLVSQQGRGDQNPVLAHTGSLTGTSTRLRTCSSPHLEGLSCLREFCVSTSSQGY